MAITTERAALLLDRFDNPGHAMREFYAWHFGQSKSDSTPKSRTHLLRRLHHTATNLRKGDTVLDLASGPQILERQYISSFGRPDFRFVSIDFAVINRLIAQQSSRVSHLRAAGESLPLRNESIAVVICNMGLEYMEEGALDELYRVLRAGGIVHANLWTKKESWEQHSSDVGGYRVRQTPRTTRQMIFWRTFLNSHTSPLLGREPTQIQEVITKHGLHITQMQEVADTETSWLAIDMVKDKTIRKEVHEW